MLESLNKAALITGASSGLGAEFAVQLAKRGYDLILIARREDRLNQLGVELESKYRIKTTRYALDISIMENIDEVINIINENSNIELLINNAGFGTLGRFSRVEPKKELSMLFVHMVAPVMFSRAILPGMISRNIGAIINVSSIAGLIPIRNVMYGSSKSFLITFSETLQNELHDTQIHIQALCPGFFFSEFHDTKEFTKFSRSNIPKFLWMTSEQVVNESLESLQKRRVICIPGKLYRFAGSLARNSITAGLIRMVVQVVLRIRSHSS